jgi:hypothetical protein
MIKDIKQQTLKATITRKVYQGKGKPAIFRKEEVLPSTQRAPPLDPKKLHNESSMSRISKKKKIG